MKKQSYHRARRQLLKQRHKTKIKATRPAHKRFLLHPATVLVLLCAGVLLFGWTLKTQADSYSVTAKVPADPLTEPATITTPSDGKHFSTSPITLNGSCPYKSYVEIYRNDVMSGVALCQVGGTFSLQLGLTPGLNQLVPHVFNITDDEGPLGPAINVFYDQPKTISSQPPQDASPTSPGTSPRPKAAVLILSAVYKYRGFLVNANASWTINIAGGTGPYAINVKWGDGSDSNYVAKASGDLTIEHVYSKAGIYSIKISSSDIDKSTSFLEITSLIVSSQTALSTGTLESGGTGASLVNANPSGLLKLLWPSYGIVLLMVFSYWLGERQELIKLTRRSSKRRR